MKIKYRNETLNPNQSKYCIDYAIYKHFRFPGTCSALCYKIHVSGGFNTIDDYEVLEL
jgi:hypothetical protein